MVCKLATALGKDVVYEEIPLLLLLRGLLWFTTILLPCLIIAGLICDKLSLTEAEMGAALWTVLAVIAYRWKLVILFNVPGEPIRMIGEGLDSVAPQGLKCSDLLKMAAEDNIGDYRPAAETFGYVPETFEQGLARILGKKADL